MSHQKTRKLSSAVNSYSEDRSPCPQPKALVRTGPHSEGQEHQKRGGGGEKGRGWGGVMLVHMMY